MTKQNGEKFDIYQFVTDRIISQLESGKIPWEKPWINIGGCDEVGAVSHVRGKPYSLLNQMLLGEPGEYLTFNQCQKEGGKIKKGAKASVVVFWKPLNVEATDKNGKPILDANGQPAKKFIPYLRYMYVYHIRDCEGIKPKYADKYASMTEEALKNRKPVPKFGEAEAIMQEYLQKSGVTLKHHAQNRAFYRPSTDEVVLPTLDQFKSSEGYYGTAFHELVHSTGHPNRLNRLDKKAGFGSDNYSKEELVAEIGAAAICNQLEISSDEELRNNAAYIQSWLKALRDDKRMIVTASSKAEKAVQMIFGADVKKEEDDGV